MPEPLAYPPSRGPDSHCGRRAGYYQLEGEEPKELEPGQAVRIPPDVKHWHGAAPHEAFSHLAFMIADGTGDATNEWLEPVDPDAYGTLR